MKTNDIKKGMRVRMSLSASMGETPRWEGTVWDNMKGNTRVVEVEGWFTEAGSVYSHDIEFVKVGDVWENVEHTPAQLKLKKDVNEIFV